LSLIKFSPVVAAAIRIPQPTYFPSPQQGHRSEIRGSSKEN